jgi:hypothetical protein
LKTNPQEAERYDSIEIARTNLGLKYLSKFEQ